MDYTIKEIEGKLYKVLANGGRFLHRERPHPAEPGIYMVTHIPTDKKYVGSTMNLMSRCGGYKPSSKTGLSKFRSLPGCELRFEVLQICSGITLKDLLSLELEWILRLNTVAPAGLNHRNPVDATKFPGSPTVKYVVTNKYYNNPKPFPF